VADGCFLPDGNFVLLPREIDTEKAESLFRHKVLSMLLQEGKITKLTVERLLAWHHSGFNVHIGERVQPEEKARREHLARYLVRAPLALDKLTYLPEEGKVIYGPRNDRKLLHPLDFLAELTQHIPDHYEHRITDNTAAESEACSQNRKKSRTSKSKNQPSAASPVTERGPRS
jgi:hypothetical protein